MNNNLKLLSLNVRGMRGGKRHEIFTWIKRNDYDICLLQETYCTPNFVKTFKRGWKGPILHSCSNSNHSRGVCILLKEGLQSEVINTFALEEGRLLITNLKLNNIDYSIVNVYAPNNCKDRVSFFKELETAVHKYALNKNNLILGGDFNCALNESDRASSFIDVSSSKLKNVIAHLNLHDVFKELNPEKIDYTYIDPQKRASHSRIDLWLIANSLISNCQKCEISPSPAPDHKALNLSIHKTDKKRGLGYWKLNTKHLEDPLYINGVKNLIHNAKSDYSEEVSSSQLWEYIKCLVKEFSIKFSIGKAKVKQDDEKYLENKLTELENKSKQSADDDNIAKERLEIKEKLSQIYKEKSVGYQIRSRAKWVEEGEKSTSYFFRLEKARQTSNCVEVLRDKSGNEKTDDADILKIAHDFYANLYSSQDCGADKVASWFNKIKHEKLLSEIDKQSCEGKIAFEECKQAVKKMKKNKSPGLDGLGAEFYQTFWDDLGTILVDVFNESFDNQKLCNTQNLSVIALIFKKGDKSEIANYRPISLSNTDYKILAFVLANRIQKVIGTIISTDQTAYIKGRSMGTNLRLVNDIINHYDNINESGILFMADFKKAFDSISWKFILQSMKFFNFGDTMIRWINTIYSGPKACIKNNGHMSEEFELKRGIRQGCPVSALLFVIAVEMLGICIRQNKELQGYEIESSSKTIKISQYADDCILFLKNKNDLCTAISILQQFGHVSGLCLNLEKCEGLWIGRDRYLQQQYQGFGVKWPEMLKYLGIYIGHNSTQIVKKNWYEKLENIKMCLETWSRRDLSLFGKVLIIKAIAVSKLVLPATVLLVPDGFIKVFEKVLFSFLWGKKEKISRKKSIMTLAEGGLNMMDIESFFVALKAKWMQKLMISDPVNDRWTYLPVSYFKKLESKNIILHFHLDKTINFQDLDKQLPFWKDAIRCYSMLKDIDSVKFKETIFSQQIWGNKFINIKRNKSKQVLFLRNWIRSGIVLVNDLSFQNGILDVDRMYGIIQDKRNLIFELQIVRNALRPYKDYLINNIIHQPSTKQAIPKFTNSKAMYKLLVKQKIQDSIPGNLPFTASINQYLDMPVNSILKRKLIDIKEIKLREFNFKIIHNILPCNEMLHKWTIKQDSKCDLCDKVQTIRHLLFECVFVKEVWVLVERMLDCKITYDDILCGFENNLIANYVSNIAAFTIYKDWLLYSLKGEKRSNRVSKLFFEHEPNLRLKIYEQAGLVYQRA